MGADSKNDGENKLQLMSRDVTSSSRKRATGLALAGALLLVIGGLVRERYLISGFVMVPGAILFLAGGLTMVFGSDAARSVSSLAFTTTEYSRPELGSGLARPR